MKVILKKRVKKVGDRYDVVDVSDGYARNYLIPNGLAKPATDSNLKQLESARKKWADRKEERKSTFESRAEELEGLELKTKEKTNEENILFGSIDKKQIRNLLEKQGFDLKEAEVSIPDPIKEAGEWKVEVTFPFDIRSEIKLVVESE